MSKLENEEKILKAASKKHQFIYKSKHIRITSDYCAETLYNRKAWSNTLQALRERIIANQEYCIQQSCHSISVEK
jgi:hypothetical protein